MEHALYRGLLTGVALALGFGAVAQCPGVKPTFRWANDGSAIAFTDLTEGTISDWIWDFGDGDTSYQQAPTHLYAFADLGDTVRLTVWSMGCEFTLEAVVAHGGENDACNSQITSAFTAEQTGNNQMHFTDLSQGDGSFLFYLWTFGDDSLGSADSADHFYALPGAYDVSHSIATVDSQFQTACVAGSAQRVLVDGNTSTCDSSLFLDLSATLEENVVTLNANTVFLDQGLVPMDWSWDYGDGTEDVSSLAGMEHTYLNEGTYQVCVEVHVMDTAGSDTSYCYARSCTTVVVVPLVGLDERDDEPSIRAWPIPFADEVLISGDPVRRGAHWRLLDALGREALVGVVGHDGQDRIGTALLPPGVYNLIIADRTTVRSLRLLKQ